MEIQTNKSQQCEWCRQQTPSKFIHYLGRAKAWVCFQCFQGEPYNEWQKKWEREQVMGALRRLTGGFPDGVRLGDIIAEVGFPAGPVLTDLLSSKDVIRIGSGAGTWLPKTTNMSSKHSS